MSEYTLRNAFNAFASYDPKQIATILTEDAEWLSPPENATAIALNTTHHMVGRAAIVRFFAEDFPRLFTRDVDITFHRRHADDHYGFAEATMTAVLPTGDHYRNDYCFTFEFHNGLVRRVHEYTDTARANHIIFPNSALQAIVAEQ